jgi:hypothetical protein
MRKPRDFDAELKSLEDKARDLRNRRCNSLANWSFRPEPTPSALTNWRARLSYWPKPRMPVRGRHGRSAEPRSFRAGRGKLHRRLTAIRAALRRNRAALNRHQAAQARNDMRTWQVERRKRARHLIELGGLVVKAGIVDLTGDDRAVIFGALLWMADKLQSDQGEHVRALWAAKGKQAFDDEQKDRKEETLTASQEALHDEI